LAAFTRAGGGAGGRRALSLLTTLDIQAGEVVGQAAACQRRLRRLILGHIVGGQRSAANSRRRRPLDAQKRKRCERS